MPVPPLTQKPVRGQRRSIRRRPTFSKTWTRLPACSIWQTFGNIYSRLTNPTVAVLEERVATLEGGTAALAVASGHAAQLITMFSLLGPGDSFVASNKLYGGSVTQFGVSFKKMDWHCHFVDPADPQNFADALTPACKAIFIESLSNPGGVVTDIAAIADIAHAAGVPLIVDKHVRHPVGLPPAGLGRGYCVAFRDEIPGRARQFPGRHHRRRRRIQLGPERQIPVHRPTL